MNETNIDEIIIKLLKIQMNCKNKNELEKKYNKKNTKTKPLKN